MVSSTLLRDIIQEGDLLKASRLLGRCYLITGTVSDEMTLEMEGERFPAMNIEYHREKVSPKPGVYTIYFTRDGKCRQGLCHIPEIGSDLSQYSLMTLFPMEECQECSDKAILVHFLESTGEDGPSISPPSADNLREHRRRAVSIFSSNRHRVHLFSG